MSRYCAGLSRLSRPPAGFLRPRLPPVRRPLLTNTPSGTGGSVPTPPPYSAAVSMGNRRGWMGLAPIYRSSPLGSGLRTPHRSDRHCWAYPISLDCRCCDLVGWRDPAITMRSATPRTAYRQKRLSPSPTGWDLHPPQDVGGILPVCGDWMGKGG